MQSVSVDFLAASALSSSPVFYVDLWKEHEFISTLTVESGSVTYDSNQNVQGSCSLVVVDTDGTIAPNSLSSPLTPFGGVLNVRAGFDIAGVEETVSLGWFLIWDIKLEEAWGEYSDYVDSFGEPILVRRGTRISIEGRDLSQKIADYQFLAPTAPSEATAWDEIVHLVKDVVSTSAPDFNFVTVPYTLTYGEDRFEAVKQLAALMDAEPIMTPDGQLTLRLLRDPMDTDILDLYDKALINNKRDFIPSMMGIDTIPEATNAAPMFGWRLNVTDFNRSFTRDGVYNVVVARGKSSSGVSLVRYSILDNGPTSFYGPMGPRPIFYDSDLLTTGDELQAWADSLLNSIVTQNTMTVPIKALPNPAIQLGDFTKLNMPGAAEDVICRIIGFTFHSEGEMDVTLSMPLNAFPVYVQPNEAT